MKHSCDFRNRQIAESFTFPFALPLNKLYKPNYCISLDLLNAKLQTAQWMKTKYDDQTQRLLSVQINGWNVYFNIYSNGKIRIWHNNNHEAIHYFVDFFYNEFVIDCLVEVV
jgi:hypothetical protein